MDEPHAVMDAEWDGYRREQAVEELRYLHDEHTSVTRSLAELDHRIAVIDAEHADEQRTQLQLAEYLEARRAAQDDHPAWAPYFGIGLPVETRDDAEMEEVQRDHRARTQRLAGLDAERCAVDRHRGVVQERLHQIVEQARDTAQTVGADTPEWARTSP